MSDQALSMKSPSSSSSSLKSAGTKSLKQTDKPKAEEKKPESWAEAESRKNQEWLEEVYKRDPKLLVDD